MYERRDASSSEGTELVSTKGSFKLGCVISLMLPFKRGSSTKEGAMISVWDLGGRREEKRSGKEICLKKAGSHDESEEHKRELTV